MRSRDAPMAITFAALLVALPGVLAHGSEHVGMAMQNTTEPVNNSSMAIAHTMDNYFRYEKYGRWNMAHAMVMILAWFIVMPLAIMLSVARSRYHLPAQILFHTVNGVGVFMGFTYNHATPDLYEHNAHHPLGWIVVAFTIIWTIMSIFVAYSEQHRQQEEPLESKQSMSDDHIATVLDYLDETLPDDSRDSTVRPSTSLSGSTRQNSTESVYQKVEEPMNDVALNDGGHDYDNEQRRGLLGNSRVDRLLSKSVVRTTTARASKTIRFCQIVLEKLLLLLGFASVTSGFIVTGGLFRDRWIFSGLAHYIKGGIFFWYGLLTLGRWMGAFTEFGWAWNVRPQHPLVSRWKTMMPSAEFTESFVIWLYGASNVFLEHMNDTGSGWKASDIEHVSITALFFGGGLLGMLIECDWVRNLLNTPVAVQKSQDEEHIGSFRYHSGLSEESDELWQEPKTYRTPLNPMPALTIMLLGMMMSGHHQTSMVSTMMHAQWGGLFSAFALARGATYILMYMKPPTSRYPSRPPTEIAAAFCLTSGGILFMNSAADTVWAIELNGLDAMTIFTLTMGLTGIIMAWEVFVFAIKGWAVRKESAAAGRPLP